MYTEIYETQKSRLNYIKPKKKKKCRSLAKTWVLIINTRPRFECFELINYRNRDNNLLTDLDDDHTLISNHRLAATEAKLSNIIPRKSIPCH